MRELSGAHAPPEAGAHYLDYSQVRDVSGPAIAVDVIRAFTTAAYAFSRGARAIYLVQHIEEAHAFKARHPDALAMGENRGQWIEGFDFSNSPVGVARADLRGKLLVQRTSGGTRGAVAAARAARLWCASLVCASATARALRASGLASPTYVITGRTPDGAREGDDDLIVAEYIESLRLGAPLDGDEVARRVAASDEARLTLKLGGAHVHPDDVMYATRVDAFSFAMEAIRDDEGLRLVRVEV